MSTEITETTSVPAGVRVLSVLLVAGGIIGIGLSVWILYRGLQDPAFAIIGAIFSALFVFTTWQGVRLWQGRPEGYRWAKILFAAQIPSFSLGGLNYGFHTLLGLNVQLGSGVQRLDFNLGSSVNAMYTPDPGPTFFGVNLIALAAFLYLLFRARFGSALPAPSLGGETGA